MVSRDGVRPGKDPGTWVHDPMPHVVHGQRLSRSAHRRIVSIVRRVTCDPGDVPARPVVSIVDGRATCDVVPCRAVTAGRECLPAPVRRGLEVIEAGGVRVVDAHVDMLELGFRLDFDRATLASLTRAAERSREENRPVVWRWWSHDGEERHAMVRGENRRRELLMWCAEWRVYMRLPEAPRGDEPPAPSSWCTFTWENDPVLEHGLYWGPRLAWLAMSEIARPIEWRVLRVDLCADVAGWPLDLTEIGRVVRHGHAGVSHHTETSLTWSLSGHEHMRGTKATGWVIGKESFVLRCYAKDVELATKNEAKRKTIEERWTRGGWRRGEPVRRVEIQCRGDLLNEIDGARDPARLVEMADRLWQYAMRRIRLVRLEDERMTRCPTDPRWTVLSRVPFGLWTGVDEIRPVKRVRKRSVATVEQTWGCATSMLASLGKIRDLLPLAESLRLRLEAHEDDDASSLAGAAVAELVRGVMGQAAEVMIATWLDQRSPRELLDRLASICELKEARYAEWRPPDRVRYADGVAAPGGECSPALRKRAATMLAEIEYAA